MNLMIVLLLVILGATPRGDTMQYGSGYSAAKANDTDSYLWKPTVRLLDPADSRILDAGCGNGYFSQHLTDLGYRVVGVDSEESGITHARTLCKDATFHVASVYGDLAGQLGAFDAVVSLEVVEHLTDPRLFVRRVFECVRPGGVFVLSTPYHGYAKNLALSLLNKWDTHMDPFWSGGHIKLWSRTTLTRLLVEGGFEVESFVGAGRIPFLWKSMIMSARKPE